MPSSAREEGVWPSSSKKDRVMPMDIFFLSSVESCGSDHVISKEEEVCSSCSSGEGKDDHGHFPPFLSEEL